MWNLIKEEFQLCTDIVTDETQQCQDDVQTSHEPLWDHVMDHVASYGGGVMSLLLRRLVLVLRVRMHFQVNHKTGAGTTER